MVEFQESFILVGFGGVGLGCLAQLLSALLEAGEVTGYCVCIY